MNRFRDRIKAETDKYSQKFFGASDQNSASTNKIADDRTPSVGSNQHHVDTQKLRFEALPHPSQDLQSQSNNQTNTSTDCPIKIRCVNELGPVLSLSTHIKRDLGFSGRLGPYALLSFGDTLWTVPPPASKNLSATSREALLYDDGVFRGMTSNSVAFATHDPNQVLDPHCLLNSRGYPDQFVKIREDWGETMSDYAVGITNIVETDPSSATGIIFTLLNHRPGGIQRFVGAGIATVSLSPPTDNSTVPVPHATRISQYIWDGETEPWFGDVGAVRDATHIYAYGHKKDNPWVYLARVAIPDVLKVDCYEYWHGQTHGWRRERLNGTSGLGEIGEEQSVFWQVNQGQVVWSPYYNRWMFWYCDNFWSSQIIVRSALKPEGPWGPPVDVIKIKPITEGGTIYSAAPQVQYDATGKTVIVGFTNHPNVIEIVKVEFE